MIMSITLIRHRKPIALEFIGPSKSFDAITSTWYLLLKVWTVWSAIVCVKLTDKR